MSEPEKIHHEASETPKVTEGHPDDNLGDDSPNELAPDQEVDALVDGVSTEPLEQPDAD